MGTRFILIFQFFEFDPVEQPVIDIKGNALLIPVHPPDMEDSGPVVAAQAVYRQPGVIPFRPAVRTEAGNIGQQHVPVLFHDVNLTIGGPASLGAQGPPCRPQATAGVYFTPHFKSTELPGLFPSGMDAG